MGGDHDHDHHDYDCDDGRHDHTTPGTQAASIGRCKIQGSSGRPGSVQNRTHTQCNLNYTR
jgi:hypothetical protein